ncbi:MAG TPA: acyl-CoA dehydrogenase family protein [Solirubrobacterales bacterium]
MRGAALHAAGSNRIAFEGPAAAAWSDAAAAARALARVRIYVAALIVGVLEDATQFSRAYAQERVAFGQPIAHHQGLAFMIVDMFSAVEQARLLVEDAARTYDRGERCDMEAGMAKLFATEAAVTVSLESMRIHGGYGFSQEYLVERLYRDAPLLILGEGTNEIQQLIIARRLIELAGNSAA